MRSRPRSSPLLHEYHRRTERGDGGQGNQDDWQVMQGRLFEPPAAPRPAHPRRLLVGSLAAALAGVWLLAASPWHPEEHRLGDSGAGGADGASGRARGWGGARGSAGG